MNCKQCNTALLPNARFCPNCGTLVDAPVQEGSIQQAPSSQPASTYDPTRAFPPQPGVPVEQNRQSPPWAPTQPVPLMQSTPWAPTQDVTSHSTQSGQPLSPLQQSPPLQYYQTNNSDRGTQMPPTTVTRNPATGPKRRRSRAGCIVSFFCVLVLLLLIVGAGWLFLLRPYLHNMAQNQLDQAMSSAVQQIPPTVVALPPGTLPVAENSINNLIVLNLAPSDPIKDPSTVIAPDGVHISFSVYGFGCKISAKPALQNGRLVVTNVAVDGLIGLIMTPDELAPVLNQHLSDAQNRLKHPIQSVQLKDHEMDLTLGSPLAV